MRAFISLELDEEAKQEILRIQKEIKKSDLFEGKLTEKGNLHLTLKFLGEIEEETLERTKEKLKEIKFKSFDAELGEIGIFSDRILWVKLEGKAIELQEEIDEKLKEIFKREARFMSHITIARIKKIMDKKNLFLFFKRFRAGKIKINIDRFLLKSSKLTPEGPIYEPIEEYKLI